MTDARRARYVALFVSESRSLIQSALRALNAWQDNPQDKAAAEEVSRSLHTIKGMSATLQFDEVTQSVHEAETQFAALCETDDRSARERFTTVLDDISVLAEAAARSVTTTAVASPAARSQHIVRVDLARLDALLADLGDLVIARQELARHAVNDPWSPLSRAATQLANRLDRMQSRILDVRLAPLAEAFERIPSMVRDLGRQLGKQVSVSVSGDELEVDRAILDQLGEPLLHLLRNALDHGLESPDERLARGKRPQGKIGVAARRDGNSVLVEISDDGRGIDRESVARRARELGWLEARAVLSDDGLLALLQRPGFSTATTVSDISGRGVGLDVVVARLHQVGASLSLSTVPGRGTVFSIRLPTRLGIVRALVASIGNERYVMPLTHVIEVVAFESGAIGKQDGRTALFVRGAAMPVVDMRRLLNFHGDPPPRHRPAVVVESNGQQVALIPDAVHGQVDAVVQPIDRPTGMARWITGATVLEDGAPVLMVDLASVV